MLRPLKNDMPYEERLGVNWFWNRPGLLIFSKNAQSVALERIELVNNAVITSYTREG